MVRSQLHSASQGWATRLAFLGVEAGIPGRCVSSDLARNSYSVPWFPGTRVPRVRTRRAAGPDTYPARRTRRSKKYTARRTTTSTTTTTTTSD
eukprot:3409458-Rhodomonas_salina.2